MAPELCGLEVFLWFCSGLGVGKERKPPMGLLRPDSQAFVPWVDVSELQLRDRGRPLGK